ncbi:MAG TPA: hypothetical protein VIY28_11840 [Pseudonocardiaceae bacterium]
MNPERLATLKEGEDEIILGGEVRYRVIFAPPASPITASTPTVRVPWRLNRSYAAHITRSRPLSPS